MCFFAGVGDDVAVGRDVGFVVYFRVGCDVSLEVGTGTVGLEMGEELGIEVVEFDVGATGAVGASFDGADDGTDDIVGEDEIEGRRVGDGE